MNVWPQRAFGPFPIANTQRWPIMPPLRHHLPKASMPETLTLIINGYQFELRTPYEPDMPIGQAEAGILNREWAQAIRTAYQPLVTTTIAHSDGKLTSGQVAQLQAELSDFASQFAFKALASPRSTDALTRQKHAIAKRVLDMRLNIQGATKVTWGEHKYEAALARLMNNHEIIRQAEQQLADARGAADMLAGMAHQ